MDSLNALQPRVDAIASKTGIDPATIIAIITAITTMIAQFCPKPVPPAALKDHGFGWDFVVIKALRENEIRPLSHEGRKLIMALRSHAEGLSEPEIETFLSLCQ